MQDTVTIAVNVTGLSMHNKTVQSLRMMFRDTLNLKIEHSLCIQRHHSSPACLGTVTLYSIFIRDIDINL